MLDRPFLLVIAASAVVAALLAALWIIGYQRLQSRNRENLKPPQEISAPAR